MRLVFFFFHCENVNTRGFSSLSDTQSSTHSMELIIIALIAVEVVIVRSFRYLVLGP